jgi:predicted Zn-ribbon and HTH transcriptional regulator
MKEAIIKMMEESRHNLLQTLKEDSEILENDEIDQMLDSLLEIEKILKTLKED